MGPGRGKGKDWKGWREGWVRVEGRVGPGGGKGESCAGKGESCAGKGWSSGGNGGANGGSSGGNGGYSGSGWVGRETKDARFFPPIP